MAIIRLSAGLLDELEARWRDQGVPLVGHVQPGLSEAEIEALAAPLGLRLPDEARTWWGWHNGVTRRVNLQMNGAGWRILSLENALKDTAQWGQIATDTASSMPGHEVDPRNIWKPEWLLLSSAPHGAGAVIDADDALRSPSPVYYFEPESPAGTQIPPGTGSIGVVGPRTGIASTPTAEARASFEEALVAVPPPSRAARGRCTPCATEARSRPRLRGPCPRRWRPASAIRSGACRARTRTNLPSSPASCAWPAFATSRSLASRGRHGPGSPRRSPRPMAQALLDAASAHLLACGRRP